MVAHSSNNLDCGFLRFFRPVKPRAGDSGTHGLGSMFLSKIFTGVMPAKTAVKIT